MLLHTTLRTFLIARMELVILKTSLFHFKIQLGNRTAIHHCRDLENLPLTSSRCNPTKTDRVNVTL